MRVTFHLGLAAIRADASAATFAATLRRADTGEQAKRDIVVPVALRTLAKELSKGAFGRPAPGAIASAGEDLFDVLAPPSIPDDHFPQLVRFALTTGGMRLVVHLRQTWPPRINCCSRTCRGPRSTTRRPAIRQSS